MITAADTNVVLDVLFEDPSHGEKSKAALRQSAAGGHIVVSDVVYAELSAAFATPSNLDEFLRQAGVRRTEASPEALHEAGRAWQMYTKGRRAGLRCADCGAGVRANCPRCGSMLNGRQHLLADFLIGGHAMFHADRLLTRDRRHFRKYFPQLTLLHP